MKTEYDFTFEDCRDYRAPAGYRNIEYKDAPYRRVFLHPATRTVLTYCEGDLTTEICESDEELAAHLDRLRVAYGSLDEEEIAP